MLFSQLGKRVDIRGLAFTNNGDSVAERLGLGEYVA